MPMEGLAYEEVARVASLLRAKGTRPTNRLVLAETGGSASTVHRHLKRWVGENPEAAPAPPELPATLQRALQEELRRIEAGARAELESRLAVSQQEAEDLARESERVQGENEALRSQLAELTAEGDRLQGQTRQQATDLERLREQLETERHAAEAARVELAQARLKAEAQQEIAQGLRSEREHLLGTLEQERAGRIEAERHLAACAAAREGVVQALEQRTRSFEELLERREQLQGALDAERSARAAIDRELAARGAEAKAAVARAEDLQRREEQARTLLREQETALRQALSAARAAGPAEKTDRAAT